MPVIEKRTFARRTRRLENAASYRRGLEEQVVKAESGSPPRLRGSFHETQESREGTRGGGQKEWGIWD